MSETENILQFDSIDRASEDSIFHGFYSVEECFTESMPRRELPANDCLCVEIVTEGEGVHCFEHKAIPCKVNDMYVVSPGVPHAFFLSDKSKPLTVRRLSFHMESWVRPEFSAAGGKRFCYGVFQDDPDVCYAMLNTRMRETVYRILDFIEAELQDKECEWREIVRSYILQLLCLVSRYINTSIKTAPQRAKELDTVNAALKVIEEEFNNCELSLEMISKRTFVSSSHLSRVFKNYMGQLFSEYLRDLRLKRAAKLLEDTELTVERIVTECGLRNVPAFYRNFRDSYGMTPQLYRELVRSNEYKNNINLEVNSIMVILSDISENVQKGKAKIVKELVQTAIDEGSSPERILNEGLLEGMSVVGEKFKNNEVYVPEVLVAARAMNMGVQILKPYLASADVKAVGKVCIGTVQGDLHDIGKNLVKMMMEGKGIEVVDLGTDVSPEAFVKTAIEENCQVICCSALLTTTMSVMGDVVKAAESAGIRNKVKIMIGGAPITQEFCDKIGADVYTVDAASAADAAVELCKA